MNAFDIVDPQGRVLKSIYAETPNRAMELSGYYGAPGVYPRMIQPVPPYQNISMNNTMTSQKRRVPHALHLVLTLLTCGLWGIVWIIDAVINGAN